ncbi:MAG: hypothetical protein R6X09_03170 [Bacteroidales bacterium]
MPVTKKIIADLIRIGELLLVLDGGCWMLDAEPAGRQGAAAQTGLRTAASFELRALKTFYEIFIITGPGLQRLCENSKIERSRETTLSDSN